MFRAAINGIIALTLLIQLGLTPVYAANILPTENTMPCAEMVGGMDDRSADCCEVDCLTSACSMPCAQLPGAMVPAALPLASQVMPPAHIAADPSHQRPPYDQPLIRPPATS